MMTQRERAIEKVKRGFKKKLANFDNKLAYHGGEDVFYAKKNDEWVKISDEEVNQVIDAHLEEWADEEPGFGLDILEVNVGRCPKCNEVQVLDALSRKDNDTNICSDCGTREALEELGL
jgi:hypothetical protein